MKKRTYLLNLIITFFLLVAFVAVSCVKESPHPVTTQMKTDLSLLPIEGNGILFVNVQQVLNSPYSEYLVKKIEEEVYNNADYRDFSEKTGFNLFKDIDRAYFIMHSVSDDVHNRAFGMAKGHFSPEKIQKYGLEKDTEDKILSEEYEGKTIYLIDQKYGFVFPDNETIFFGPFNDLKKAIVNHNNSGSGSDSWLNTIRDVKYKNGLYMTLKTDQLVKGLADRFHGEELKGGMAAINSLQMASFSVDMENNFKFNGIGNFDSEEKAELFFDAGKGMWAAAKLTFSDDREVVDIANKVDFSLENKTVKVEGSFTEKEMKKLMKKSETLSRKAIALK